MEVTRPSGFTLLPDSCFYEPVKDRPSFVSTAESSGSISPMSIEPPLTLREVFENPTLTEYTERASHENITTPVGYWSDTDSERGYAEYEGVNPLYNDVYEEACSFYNVPTVDSPEDHVQSEPSVADEDVPLPENNHYRLDKHTRNTLKSIKAKESRLSREKYKKESQPATKSQSRAVLDLSINERSFNCLYNIYPLIQNLNLDVDIRCNSKVSDKVFQEFRQKRINGRLLRKKTDFPETEYSPKSFIGEINERIKRMEEFMLPLIAHRGHRYLFNEIYNQLSYLKYFVKIIEKIDAMEPPIKESEKDAVHRSKELFKTCFFEIQDTKEEDIANGLFRRFNALVRPTLYDWIIHKNRFADLDQGHDDTDIADTTPLQTAAEDAALKSTDTKKRDVLQKTVGEIKDKLCYRLEFLRQGIAKGEGFLSALTHEETPFSLEIKTIVSDWDTLIKRTEDQICLLDNDIEQLKGTKRVEEDPSLDLDEMSTRATQIETDSLKMFDVATTQFTAIEKKAKQTQIQGLTQKLKKTESKFKKASISSHLKELFNKDHAGGIAGVINEVESEILNLKNEKKQLEHYKRLLLESWVKEEDLHTIQVSELSRKVNERVDCLIKFKQGLGHIKNKIESLQKHLRQGDITILVIDIVGFIKQQETQSDGLGIPLCIKNELCRAGLYEKCELSLNPPLSDQATLKEQVIENQKKQEAKSNKILEVWNESDRQSFLRNTVSSVQEGKDFESIPFDEEGNTIFHRACLYGDHNFVLYLLEKGYLNIKNKEGWTGLHAAANSNFIPIVKSILEKGGNPLVIGKDGLTPLHAAAQNGNDDSASLLVESIKKKKDKVSYINLKDDRGRTALHLAAQFGLSRMTKMLIDCGANVKLRTNKGMTYQDCAQLHKKGTSSSKSSQLFQPTTRR
jgi:hypothetical protein